MATSALNAFSAKGIVPLYDGEDARALSIMLRKTGSAYVLAKGTVLGEITGTNAIYTLVFASNQASGTVILNLPSTTTYTVNFNDTAAAVQAGIEASAGVGVGNVKVTKEAMSAGTQANIYFRIEFVGAMGGQAVTVTKGTDGLTSTLTSVQTGSAASANSLTSAGAQTNNNAVNTWRAYNPANTDGTQIPKLILQYDVAVDANGLVAIAGQTGTGDDWGNVHLTTPGFYAGTFDAADLTGYTAAVRDGYFRQINGLGAAGCVRLG